MTHFFPRWGRVLLLLALPFAAQAQSIGIGTTAPDVSAALDIVSGTKGALLPRVAAAAALGTPATGLLVYQTGAPAGFYYNAGTPGAPLWQQIATAAGTRAGFIQNQNAADQAASFRISGTGSTLGNFGVGTSAPTYRLQVVGGAVSSGTGGFMGYFDRTDATKLYNWYAAGGRSTLNLSTLGASNVDLFTIASTGAVGIGTTAPDVSAALDVSSTSKGLLPPRMSTAQRDAIAGPAAGLTLFNTTTGKLNTWNGTSWDAGLSATEQPLQNPAVTFNYTGGTQTYLVPAGVTTVLVDAAGARGGNSASNGTPGGMGGGARVQARLAVTPGETLTLYVGGEGGNGNSPPYGVAGGYNGGGDGGLSGGFLGGGGGGASDVRRGAAGLAQRLLVAAGGGGGGGYGGPSGAGGGPDGEAGANSFNGAFGTGATQSAGGSPGGALGQGGSGSNGGGGGGGGYYGGGASSIYSGGGGGGSSWVVPTGGTNVSMTSSYQPGNGVIRLTPAVVYSSPSLDGTNFVNVPGTWSVSGADVYHSTGNVGIGTSTPAFPLQVAGGAVSSGGGGFLGYFDRADATKLYNWYAVGGRSTLNLSTVNGGSADLLTVASTGNVGIGTTAPAFPLDVQATVTPANFNYGYLNGSGNTGYGPNNTGPVSIRATGRVLASEFNATSDRRLKTIVGLSNNAADLALLNRLRITDYTMRDRVQFGHQPFKKVIAQEVEEVFPQAVHLNTGFLPDVYAPATAVQALPGDSLVALTLPAPGLPCAATAGQRLKLMGEKQETLAALARPAAAGARTLVLRRAQALAGGKAFVFGLEHADVRSVDYEALSMLHVSATQELARKVAALEQQNAALRQQATTQTTRLDQQQASLSTLQEQMARLLGDTAPASAQARK